jgi:hypothetical protein
MSFVNDLFGTITRRWPYNNTITSFELGHFFFGPFHVENAQKVTRKLIRFNCFPNQNKVSFKGRGKKHIGLLCSQLLP